MKLIGPFKQLLTIDGLPDKGPLSDDQLRIIPDAGVIVSEGLIKYTGNFLELKSQSNPSTVEYLDEEYVGLPGMIDAHTHICWAGSRANDYAMRLSGKTYLDVAASGGGIWDTVTRTRSATALELFGLTLLRANRLLEQGVTTIEVKSGYGLSADQELKMLEAIAETNQKTAADLIPTCLAAHVLPNDFKGNENAYLEQIVKDLLPEILTRNLAKRIDIFVEKGAFSVEAAKKYLMKVKAMGFERVIHGDQFSSNAASLANDVEAISIDHLEAADDKEISILAGGNVIPVVLPGSSLGLAEPFAPARKMLNAGTSLVIASDWNPGSAPMGNLLTEAAVFGMAQKLTMAETWAAVTFRAAKALRLNDRGQIKSGYLADIISFKTGNFKEILYNQGQLKPARIWKNGKCILQTA